jgi:hypothetical protein
LGNVHVLRKANCKPWDLEIGFTMPGEPTLYRDFKPTGVSEGTPGSAAARESAEASGEWVNWS